MSDYFAARVLPLVFTDLILGAILAGCVLWSFGTGVAELLGRARKGTH